MVRASGVDSVGEVLTCEGRIDMVSEVSDKVFIFEFKCDQSAKAAIEQIRNKDYAGPYKRTGKKIVQIGTKPGKADRSAAPQALDPGAQARFFFTLTEQNQTRLRAPPANFRPGIEQYGMAFAGNQLRDADYRQCVRLESERVLKLVF